VLAITDALDGPSQAAISNRAGVDRGSLSRLVKDLEYEGLVERPRAHTDQRRILCFRHSDGQRRRGRGRWSRRQGVPHHAPAPAREGARPVARADGTRDGG
jgi:MarR family